MDLQSYQLSADLTVEIETLSLDKELVTDGEDEQYKISFTSLLNSLPKIRINTQLEKLQKLQNLVFEGNVMGQGEPLHVIFKECKYMYQAHQ